VVFHVPAPNIGAGTWDDEAVSRRHFFAGFRALPARLGARLHLRIVTHLLAGVATTPADFRAGAADVAMQIRSTEHEVFAHMANLHAVRQQADVVRVGVWPTFVQAVMGRLQTDVVAIGTLFDALTHLGGDVLMGRHRELLSGKG
jgi:hypothetical protein